MENAYPVTEFEAQVTDQGTLVVPRAVARTLVAGSTVTVRLTDGVVAGALRRRGVTEDEVERIAACQLEPRDNVVRFLGTEGILASSRGFRRRSAAPERP